MVSMSESATFFLQQSEQEGSDWRNVPAIAYSMFVYTSYNMFFRKFSLGHVYLDIRDIPLQGK